MNLILYQVFYIIQTHIYTKLLSLRKEVKDTI